MASDAETWSLRLASLHWVALGQSDQSKAQPGLEMSHLSLIQKTFSQPFLHLYCFCSLWDMGVGAACRFPVLSAKETERGIESYRV